MDAASPSLAAQALGELAPCEVAARLAHLPGLIFFDSACAPAGISLVAAEPAFILEGSTPGDWDHLTRELARRTERSSNGGAPRGFAGGWVGYDGAFRFGFYEQALIYRHESETWQEVGALSQKLTAPSTPTPGPGPRFSSATTREEFCRLVARAHAYIAAGDIYQVNLAHRFSAPWQGDPFALYESLRCYSPAPHAAYVRLGETAVLSASPELFLRFSGRLVRTRPIKGTRPRFRDPPADEKSAYDLLTSPKEMAELIMITDLERNDLGQVCEYGSVSVRELVALERFEQVFHLVSTVEGQLREGVDQVTALRACFPGGSITGAPKKRAREIIAELEPEPRGLYTGAIGWFGFNGESQFNIAIRTMLVEPDCAHFHVGAGIVADSVPEREWEETLAKASGLLLAAERLGAK